MNSERPRKWDKLIVNANLATMSDNGHVYGQIRDAALAINSSNIAWIGKLADLPDAPENCANSLFNANGLWLTPGLIDCHTHLIFAGSRAWEFEFRLNGKSYQEIAEDGGGILSTVRATRNATDNTLLSETGSRLQHLLAEGVTSIEIKSGYGLDLENEMRILSACKRLQDRHPIDIYPTLLGAHAVPEEFSDNPDGYVDLVCEEMIPRAADQNLAEFVDAYCETLAFSQAQVRRVFDAAKAHGLDVRLHADQFSDTGGAALAAEYGALSADHLEYTTEEGVRAMAESGTVAVLLPGAFYMLKETHRPPIDKMREHGVRIAVATDCNPGSSPLSSILTTLNLSCITLGLTPEEALKGVTVNAARALGIEHRCGTLEVGKVADIALWNIEEPSELAYWIGGRKCRHLYKNGEPLF